LAPTMPRLLRWKDTAGRSAVGNGRRQFEVPPERLSIFGACLRHGHPRAGDGRGTVCAERPHAAGRRYAPGMIPGFPLAVPGIKYNLRCEAVTACRIETVDFQTLVGISLGKRRMTSSVWPTLSCDGIWCNCAAPTSWAACWRNGLRWHRSNWPGVSQSTSHVGCR